MQRRIIAARIEAGENPEHRTFKRSNLMQWVADNRPRLVAAALTILRAYQVLPDAGKAKVEAGMAAYGSYEDWYARVRAPLVWLGEPDPVATNARFKAAEPEREALGAVLRALHDRYVVKWFKAKDAIGSVYDDDLAEALAAANVTPEALPVLSENFIRTYL
jgi:hypothetical protein